MASRADRKEEEAGQNMDRRVIRVEILPDQAGIAAALRRAFAAGPIREEDCDRLFGELLKQLH
jgi:hypothetical protein